MKKSAILDGLKRTDVSQDKEKTKIRVADLWKSAARDVKRRILDEGTIKGNTVYRIFREGAITPKVAVIIAEGLNADPFYLTGEADENAGYSEQALDHFLREKGYGKLLDDLGVKAKRAYTRRAPAQGELQDAGAPDSGASDAPGQQDEAFDSGVCGCVCIDPDFKAAALFSEDEQILMLRALNLRAKHSDTARTRLNEINRILFDD